MAYSMHMVKVPGTHCRKKCGNKAIKLLFWGLVTKLSNHNLKTMAGYHYLCLAACCVSNRWVNMQHSSPPLGTGAYLVKVVVFESQKLEATVDSCFLS